MRKPLAPALSEEVVLKSERVIVEFDAILSEGYVSESEITRHPVEASADVSDHIIPQRRTLELVGVVSDTPIVKASRAAEDFIAGEARKLERMETLKRVAGLAGPARLLVSDYEPGSISLANPHEARGRQAWAELERMRAERAIVSVGTEFQSYPSMAIARLDMRREARAGVDMEVAILLEEVIAVDAKTAEIPEELFRQSKGPQTATRATAAQAKEATAGRDRSLAHQLFFD